MRLEGKSLKSDFLRFIIPSIIAQWVFSLYTMVDGIFVARGVSEVALTAVNISMPFTNGAVFHLYPVCGGKFDNRGDSSGTGRKRTCK